MSNKIKNNPLIQNKTIRIGMKISHRDKIINNRITIFVSQKDSVEKVVELLLNQPQTKLKTEFVISKNLDDNDD